jgi:hypothetical protein
MKKIQPKLILTVICCSLMFSQNAICSNKSIEYQLATINAGKFIPENHVTVARFRNLLEQMSAKFVENKQQIADYSVFAVTDLKKNGLVENLLNLMEDLNRLFYLKNQGVKYSETVALYLTSREKGMTHQDAVQGIKEIYSAFGVR